MEITTLSNLMSLATDVSGHSFDSPDAKLSEESFTKVVADSFDKIDMLHKWNRPVAGEAEGPLPEAEGDLITEEQDLLEQEASEELMTSIRIS